MSLPMGEDQQNTVARYVPYWLMVLVCYVVAFSGAAALWVRDYREVETDAEVLAREQGAIVFSLIQLSRQWNAGHGGVWVKETATNPPNPYLDHPERDLVTVDGTRLTMVNPAYMSRQMAELASAADSRLRLRFHLTSLNPIRPGNQADDWESESLRLFETGVKERLSYFEAGVVAQASNASSPVYRYMAPLRVNAACMACHAKQGYKVGDIRGGISVTMEANHFRDMVRSHQESKTVSYFAMAFLVAGMFAEGTTTIEGGTMSVGSPSKATTTRSAPQRAAAANVSARAAAARAADPSGPKAGMRRVLARPATGCLATMIRSTGEQCPEGAYGQTVQPLRSEELAGRAGDGHVGRP